MQSFLDVYWFNGASSHSLQFLVFWKFRWCSCYWAQDMCEYAQDENVVS